MIIFDWACAWVQDQQSVWSQYEQDTFIWHNYLSHLGKNREKNVRARSLALSLPLFLSLTPCKHTNKRAQTHARARTYKHVYKHFKGGKTRIQRHSMYDTANI